MDFPTPRNRPITVERAKLIDEMLKSCLLGVENESTARFIESINTQWQTGHFLTDKQIDALKRVHDNL